MPSYDEISKSLLDHLIVNHKLDEGSDLVTALTSLDARMTMFLASGTARDLLASDPGNATWMSSNKDGTTDIGGGSCRLVTYEMNSVLYTSTPIALQANKEGQQRYNTKEVMPPAFEMGQHSASVQANVVRYLKLLMGKDGPLEAQAKLAKDICDDQTDYMPVVSVDYYASRSTGQIGLHKDTTGFTLFVVLHYLNSKDMLGPEYARDLKPIEAINFLRSQEITKDAYWKGTWISDTRRARAPWSKVKDGSKTFWPDVLLQGLADARTSMVKDGNDTLEYTNLTPYGLLCFVDELIYHSTPLDAHRDRSDDSGALTEHERKLGQAVCANYPDNKRHQVLPNQLKRRMSMDLSDGVKLASMTGGMNDRRSFLRLWISVVPKSGYFDRVV